LSLASAHQNHDNREYSYAIIDGCTALELAMSRRIRNAYKYSKIIKSARDSFFKLPKESQLVYLASFEGSITEENLEQAILAIKLRNDIVHDGYEPPIDKSTDNKIKALLSVTTYLLPGSTFKFPQLNSGNKLF
jgi:hypothetical protein